MNIQENVEVKPFSKLKVGGQFRYFIEITNKEEIPNLISLLNGDKKYNNIPIFILGGGSNTVFSDGVINVIAIKISIKGFEIINDTGEFTDIKIGAGEDWDEVVKKTLDMNLSGLESLSYIPGVVGSSPVQNIGAYGTEVKDTIIEVEVIDRKTGIISSLSNKDCEFKYRDSIFKNTAKGKYIITSVTYRLNKNKLAKDSNAFKYEGIRNYFKDSNLDDLKLKDIREAVITLRKKFLLDPNEVPNLGSFFINPIVDNDIVDKIVEEFPEAKTKFWPEANGLKTKIPVGWLIDKAGLRGKSFQNGKVTLYENNAIVLTNTGNATFSDVILARDEVIRIVKEKFGIEIKQEPEIV